MKLRELRDYAENEINDVNANVSLLVHDFTRSEDLLSFHAGQKVVSASTIKTLILLAALKKVQKGELDLNQTVTVPAREILSDTRVFDRGVREYRLEELLTWMIITSDNTATNALIELLGMDAINAYCGKLKLESTVLERKMLDWDAVERGLNNYTSAVNQLTVFAALHRKAILTPDLCDYALGILKRQRDYSMAFRYIADKSLTAAHKTGGLDHLNHDCGLFYLDGNAYYFGCFVSESVDDTKENPVSKKLIGRISSAVYEYFKGV